MKTKKQKQQEALQRQTLYDKLSFGEKINHITKRPGKSTKELQKLYANEIRLNGNGGKS